MELENKGAIVTGAASGIGREIAMTLASRGASVTLADRNLPGAESAAQQIREAGGTARAAEVDVTSRAQVEAMAGAAVAAHGSLDIFANVAGFGKHVV